AAEIAATIGGLPGASRIESRATMTCGIGHGAHNGNRVGATIVSSCRSIERPGRPKLDRLIGAWADDARRCRVGDGHRLAATRKVAATISRLPCSGRIECASAMTAGVGDGADNRNRVGATVVGRRRRIEAPRSTEFDALVGAAANDHRRGGVHHSYGLAALRVVAAAISGSPGARRVKSPTAMPGGVRNGAQDHYGNVAPQSIPGRRWCVESPGTSKLDGLVGAGCAIHYRRGRIDDVHSLAAAAEIAASIRRLPRAGRIEG